MAAMTGAFGTMTELPSAAMTGSKATFYYAPFLVVFGVITGILTGVIFAAVLPALEKQKNIFR